MLRILFVDTEAGLWKHALLNYQLIKIIKEDFEVIHLSCGGAFESLCTMRTAKNIDFNSSNFDKKRICQSCKFNSTLVEKKIGSVFKLSLSEYVNEYESNKIVLELSKLTVKQIYNYQHMSIPVGKIAIYESIIKFKLNKLDMNKSQKQFYLEKIKTTISAIQAGVEIINRFSPDIIIVNNPGYVVGGAFTEIALQRKIRIYNFSAPGVLSEFYSTANLYKLEKKAWAPDLRPKWLENNTINTKSRVRIWNYKRFMKKASSPFIYSEENKNENARSFYHIPKENKVILAVLNSFDERFASASRGLSIELEGNQLVFNTQIDWIKELIQWVSKQEKLTLVVRPHPRDFKNKRDDVASSHGAVLMKFLDSCDESIKISKPDDKFSVFDFFSSVNVMTTGWSSLALDAMLYGIPVVNYDENLISHPKKLSKSGKSQREYFENLKFILENGRSNVIKDEAKSWFTYKYLENPIYLGGGILDRNIFGFNIENKFTKKLVHNIDREFIRKLELSIPPSKRDRVRIINILNS